MITSEEKILTGAIIVALVFVILVHGLLPCRLLGWLTEELIPNRCTINQVTE